MTFVAVVAGVAVGYAAFVIVAVLRDIRRARAAEFQQEIDDYP